MSLVVALLLVMLIVRHRKNFVRIAAGTEPRVPIGHRRAPVAGATSQVPSSTNDTTPEAGEPEPSP